MVFTRNQYKIGRTAMFKQPQTNLGLILSWNNDIRNEILEHLDEEDLIRCCMVTKEAYVVPLALNIRINWLEGEINAIRSLKFPSKHEEDALNDYYFSCDRLHDSRRHMQEFANPFSFQRKDAKFLKAKINFK
jgi:hypothetical protein